MPLCAGQGAALYLKFLQRRRRRQDDRPFKQIPKIRGFKGNRVIYEDGFYSQGSNMGPPASEQSSCYFVQSGEFHHSHLGPEENIYSELEFPPGGTRGSSAPLDHDEEDDDISDSEDDDSSTTTSSEDEEERGRLPWFDRSTCDDDDNSQKGDQYSAQSIVLIAGQKEDLTPTARKTIGQNGGQYHVVMKTTGPTGGQHNTRTNQNNGQHHVARKIMGLTSSPQPWLLLPRKVEEEEEACCSISTSSSSTNTSVQEEDEEVNSRRRRGEMGGTSLVSSPDSGYKSRQSSNPDTSYLSSDSSSEEELCKIHVAGEAKSPPSPHQGGGLIWRKF